MAVIVVSLTTVTLVAAVAAEVHRGGAGESGAGDRHAGAAAGGAAVVGLRPRIDGAVAAT